MLFNLQLEIEFYQYYNQFIHFIGFQMLINVKPPKLPKNSLPFSPFLHYYIKITFNNI